MGRLPNGRRQRQVAKKTRRAPRTPQHYDALRPGEQRRYDAALRAVSRMRQDGVSLSVAARDAGVSARTIQRFVGSTLRRSASGRYVVAPRDTLLRIMVIPSARGPAEITIKNSRSAQLLSEYWNAVQRFLETGDPALLQKFRGKSIVDTNGVRVPLLTDLTELERLGNAGVLTFESIYARAA